jgi:hypothetical protein
MIAQYILQQKPYAVVVLNSLLPRGDSEGKLLAWEEWQDMNTNLECYASETDRVVLYNATDLFTVLHPDDGSYRVNLEYMPDGVHLYRAGSEAFAQEIVKTVQDIIHNKLH